MLNTVSLKRNKDFIRVYKKGSFFAGQRIVIYVLNNKDNINKLGITTVKNFGSSVIRNRMRRLIKENYRLMENKINTGWDIVFLIRKTDKANMPGYGDVEREMKYLLRRTGILE